MKDGMLTLLTAESSDMLHQFLLKLSYRATLTLRVNIIKIKVQHQIVAIVMPQRFNR